MYLSVCKLQGKRFWLKCFSFNHFRLVSEGTGLKQKLTTGFGQLTQEYGKTFSNKAKHSSISAKQQELY